MARRWEWILYIFMSKTDSSLDSLFSFSLMRDTNGKISMCKGFSSFFEWRSAKLNNSATMVFPALVGAEKIRFFAGSLRHSNYQSKKLVTPIS